MVTLASPFFSFVSAIRLLLSLLPPILRPTHPLRKAHLLALLRRTHLAGSLVRGHALEFIERLVDVWRVAHRIVRSASVNASAISRFAIARTSVSLCIAFGLSAYAPRADASCARATPRHPLMCRLRSRMYCVTSSSSDIA